MSRRKGDFTPLGKIIEDWRRSKYRSAREMHRSVELSVGYSTYVEFEKGAALPSVEQLIEMARAMGQPPEEALLVWAQVQMPEERYRLLFRKSGEAPTEAAPADHGKVFPYEDQWVFGKSEHRFLQKEPWFFEFCLKLVLAFPEEVSFRELGLKDRESQEAFEEKFLKPWVLLERLEVTDRGVRAVDAHLRIPNTAEWATIRSTHFRMAYESLDRQMTSENVAAGKAYREVITRGITPRQMEQWLDRLRAVEDQFLATPESTLKEGPAHTLMMMLAPRDLGLPKDVLERCRVEK